MTYILKYGIIIYKEKIKKEKRKKEGKKIMAKKELKLSVEAQGLYDLMVKEGRALTLAEVKELGYPVNSSHFTALKNRGMINADKIEREYVTVTKRAVNVYSLNPDFAPEPEEEVE